MQLETVQFSTLWRLAWGDIIRLQPSTFISQYLKKYKIWRRKKNLKTVLTVDSLNDHYQTNWATPVETWKMEWPVAPELRLGEAGVIKQNIGRCLLVSLLTFSRFCSKCSLSVTQCPVARASRPNFIVLHLSSMLCLTSLVMWSTCSWPCEIYIRILVAFVVGKNMFSMQKKV